MEGTEMYYGVEGEVVGKQHRLGRMRSELM